MCLFAEKFINYDVALIRYTFCALNATCRPQAQQLLKVLFTLNLAVLCVFPFLTTICCFTDVDRFVWSKLQFPLEMKLTIPGRCHAYVSFCRNLSALLVLFTVLFYQSGELRQPNDLLRWQRKDHRRSRRSKLSARE